MFIEKQVPVYHWIMDDIDHRGLRIYAVLLCKLILWEENGFIYSTYLLYAIVA